MQRARPLLAWVTITSLSTLVTWQVVAAASDEVNDVPQTPMVVAVAAPATTVLLTASSSTETAVSPSTSSPSTTIGLVDEPSSTTTTTSTAAPPPPPPPSPTSITQPPPASGVATVGSAGGTVTVSYRDGQVYFEGATPAPGYSVEVDDDGPEHVVVEFESEDETIEVRIEWRDGELVSQVETED